VAITTLAGMSTGATQKFDFRKSTTTSSGSTFPTLTWIMSGRPDNGGIGTSLSGNTVSSTSAGAFPYKDPVSGNTYLSKLDIAGKTELQGGFTILADLLWVSGAVGLVTTTQTVNSVAFPARDRNGSTDGDGVFIGLSTSSQYGSFTAHTATISYTNSVNTSGRTGTVTPSSVITNSTRFAIFNLDSGDVGVRSIQSLTFSAVPGTSGSSFLFAFRPIALVPVMYTRGCSVQMETAFSLGAPRIYDSSALTFMLYNSQALGTITLSQG